MNQLNHNPMHMEGTTMPTKAPAPSWNQIDEKIGKDILYRAENYDHKMYNKGHRLSMAAYSLGYKDGYKDKLLTGVRAYISSMHAPARKEEDVSTAKDTKNIDKKFIKDLEKDWGQEFENNPDFRRANTIPD